MEMEMMYYHQLARSSSYQDYLKVVEADIQQANSLAAAIPYGKTGSRLQMKLVYNEWAPLFLYLLQRIDFSCICLLPRNFNLFHVLVYKVHGDCRPSLPHGRKASINEFYNVIFPSLQRLHTNLEALEDIKDRPPRVESVSKKKMKGDNRHVNIDIEREDECGICLEPCTKIVLPNCCHSMCIKCYRNWNTRSASCPFCRGSLKRVNSEDLWVLTCDKDVVDTKTVSREDLLRFYLFINSLPKDYPDALFLVYYEYLM